MVGMRHQAGDNGANRLSTEPLHSGTMRVRVNLLPTKKETRVLDLEDRATVEEAMRAAGLLPDGWIAVRRDEPLPLDEPLEDDDEVDLISVVSGG
jgi:sulfur carrier protein ThiS